MNLSQNPELSKSLTYLKEIELLAQDIATLRETKLELSNVLNKLQESLRALQKTEEKRSFLKVGLLFIEGSTEECKRIVLDEINQVKEQYTSTSNEVREKLMKKRDIENEPQIKGISLRPLSYAEANGLMKAESVIAANENLLTNQYAYCEDQVSV